MPFVTFNAPNLRLIAVGLALSAGLLGTAIAEAITYTVKTGDSVYRIARNHNITIDALRAVNPAIANTDTVKVGQILTLPDRVARRASAPAAVVRAAGISVSWVPPVTGVITTPFLGVKSRHPGLDIAAPTGTPIVAARDGHVREAHFDEQWGWGGTVLIDHGGGWTSRYSHNSELLVKPGDRVQAGQVIAKVGSTGNSTGPHLDYRVYKDGVPLDPLQLR